MNNTRFALEGIGVGSLTVTGLTLPFNNIPAAVTFAFVLFVVAVWQNKKHPHKSIFDR